MKLTLALLLSLVSVSVNPVSVERRALDEIVLDEFLTEVLTDAEGAGDDHLASIIWFPSVYWEAMMARDTTTSEFDKQAILEVMEDISLVAVTQADISPFGSFRFYPKKEVEKNLSISYQDTKGDQRRIHPIKNIGPDLSLVLGAIEPMMAAVAGNFGENMHFFVISESPSKDVRILDAYRKGRLDVRLSRSDEVLMHASIETPLNSLFVPRVCPNGKEAHVSWNYCPWTGKRLEK